MYKGTGVELKVNAEPSAFGRIMVGEILLAKKRSTDSFYVP
jgi:hypothetical protein